MNNRTDSFGKKMAVGNNLVFNLVLWISSFVLFLFLFTEDGQPKSIDFVYTGSFLATIIPPVLINFYILIPQLLKKERYLFYAGAFILNILLFAQLNIWFFEHLIDFIFPHYYFISYHSNITLFTIFGAFLTITTLIKLSVDWINLNKVENRELKLKNQQMQSKLASLRSQLNPHFLFNSLNVIYALALEKKETIKDAIVQLSDILRYVIYDSSTQHVTLKEEVTFLKNYIEFHQFRHQQNHNITFNCTIDDENYPLYPMLLLPLVENSFKYGINSGNNNTFIRIDLTQNHEKFRFDIENSYSESSMQTNEHSGVGLENIRKNLEIVYPKKHEFNITKTEDAFRVTLNLYNHED